MEQRGSLLPGDAGCVVKWLGRLLVVSVTLYGVIALGQYLLDNLSPSKGIAPSIGGVLAVE